MRLTHINNANVHAEGFARKVCNVSHVVAEIPDSNQPVPNSRPYCSPAHEPRIERDIIDLDNIVDRIVK